MKFLRYSAADSDFKETTVKLKLSARFLIVYITGFVLSLIKKKFEQRNSFQLAQMTKSMYKYIHVGKYTIY